MLSVLGFSFRVQGSIRLYRHSCNDMLMKNEPSLEQPPMSVPARGRVRGLSKVISQGCGINLHLSSPS